MVPQHFLIYIYIYRKYTLQKKTTTILPKWRNWSTPHKYFKLLPRNHKELLMTSSDRWLFNLLMLINWPIANIFSNVCHVTWELDRVILFSDSCFVESWRLENPKFSALISSNLAFYGNQFFVKNHVFVMGNLALHRELVFWL